MFFHISKTGGSALRAALESPDSEVEQLKLTTEQILDPKFAWLDVLTSHNDPYKYVWHHAHARSCDNEGCWGKPVDWFVVWRDPVDRIISQYFYVRHYDRGALKEKSRAAHLSGDHGVRRCVLAQEEGCVRNWMTHMLCGHADFCNWRVFNRDDRKAQMALTAAKTNLAKFKYVLRQESLSEDYNSMWMTQFGHLPRLQLHHVRVTSSGSRNTSQTVDVDQNGMCPRWSTNERFCGGGGNNCIPIDLCKQEIRRNASLISFLQDANQLDIELTRFLMDNQPLEKQEQCAIGAHLHSGRCVPCSPGTVSSFLGSECVRCRRLAQPEYGAAACSLESWEEVKRLKEVDCDELVSKRNLKVGFTTHVKDVSKAVFHGTEVIVNRVMPSRVLSTGLKGFSTGFIRSIQMSSANSSHFPVVTGACRLDNGSNEMPSYLTARVKDAITIDKFVSRLKPKPGTDFSTAIFSFLLQYGASLLTMQHTLPLYPNAMGAPLVYCDHQKKHILFSFETNLVSIVDLDEAGVYFNNTPVRCHSVSRSGTNVIPYEHEDGTYTPKRHSFKYAELSSYLFLSQSFVPKREESYQEEILRRFRAIRESDSQIVPRFVSERVYSLLEACLEPNDALRPNLEMVVGRLRILAVANGITPLVHVHAPLSGGTALAKLLTGLHDVVRVPSGFKMPWFAGRTTWHWVCGVHPSVQQLVECLRSKYLMSRSSMAYNFVTIFRDPKERALSEYKLCLSHDGRRNALCLSDASEDVNEYVFSEPYTNRQLWMMSGISAAECAINREECYAKAVKHLHDTIFIICDKFDAGIKYLGKLLHHDFPGNEIRPQFSNVTEYAKKLDNIKFAQEYYWEQKLYTYACKLFALRESSSHALWI